LLRSGFGTKLPFVTTFSISSTSHFNSEKLISLTRQSATVPSALSPTSHRPSASFTIGRTWWKPDIFVVQRMRARPVRSAMLALSRSATAHGDVHMPVQR